jgi:hypothetical protein
VLPRFASTRQGARGLTRNILAALLIATSLVAMNPSVASAQATVSLPVLVPSPVPEGYVVAGAEDEDLRAMKATVGHLVYAAAGPSMLSGQPFSLKDRRVAITSQPSNDSISDSIKKGGRGTTKVTIGKKRGLASVAGSYGSLIWADGNAVFKLEYIGPKVTISAMKAIALTVKPSKLQDRSFTLTKVPAGTAIRYSGSQSALFGNYGWSTEYRKPSGDRLQIAGTELNPVYLEVFLPFLLALIGDDGPDDLAFQTTTVRGRNAIAFGPTLIWEESPNQLMSIGSEDLNIEGLRAVAETMQPLDTAGWEALKAQAASFEIEDQNGSLPGPEQQTVAAGMVGNTPWTVRPDGASVSSRCYRFDIGATNAQLCAFPDFEKVSVAWKSVVSEDKRTIVGIATAKVATVVLRDRAGVEIARAAPVQMQGATYKAFVFHVGQAGTLLPVANGEAVLVGLDAAGTETGPVTSLTL